MPSTLSKSLLVAALVGLSACELQDRNALFLPEGDPGQGQDAFVALGCTGCHSVSGVDLPDPGYEREVHHVLGGRRSVSYTELVTSIINPSHRVSVRFRLDDEDSDDRSPMANYNDRMTVTQLIDLVAFLESQYNIPTTGRYRYVPHRSAE